MTPDTNTLAYGAGAAVGAAVIAQFAPPVLPSGPVVGFGQFLLVGLAGVAGAALTSR